MTGLIERLANAPDPAVFFVAALAVATLVAGFSGLRRSRHIEDVPTARVRSAPQGYVELVGTARVLHGEPIIAPLSQTPCCWYSYRIERRRGRDWSLVQSATSDGIFLLRDETGDCVIDPEGAEVTSRHKRSWAGDGSGLGGGLPVHARLPSLGRKADLVVEIGGRLLEGLGSGLASHRYTEAVILDGDPLYAIGHFHTLGPAEQVSTLHELTGAILREWKKRPDTLRERFDTNRDGIVDVHEWEQARVVAEREAAREHVEHLKRDQLHTLKRPADGRYFLLSNLEEFGLLRRYRWRKRVGFGLSLLSGLALAVMLSTRL